ncbi:DUF6069 family protein [Nonomuraea jiangxiensis]|uniref:Uncharacterized protein n=1 Tax=Nonomuraea jiangxiensis TaxID=633440 RepID=A0A1G8TIF4_9ACTN|nr:DUF6069 family protein [Nonomuraea jiangxiensis]SDJ41154.1 hypothetical protein SAMN05421869_110191 [Nonomuraea jiangxiensis]
MTQGAAPGAPASRARGRAAVIVAATVMVALVLNLAIYAVGRALGGDFRFTAQGRPAEVDATTLGGFTVVPLLVGMTLAALLSRIWRPVILVAMVVAPALALVTIPIMTIPADLDEASTITLALCHVALVPVTLAGLLALRALHRESALTPAPE